MTLTFPDGISVTSTLNGLCLQLNWSPVVGLTNYRVYESGTTVSGYTYLGTVAGLTYFRTTTRNTDNLENLWWYRVSGYDLSLDSESLQSGPHTYFSYASFEVKPTSGLSLSTLLGQTYPAAFPRELEDFEDVR